MERRILPESIIRHHIRELDSYSSSTGVFSRRTLRTERPLDDPVREMEGMLVDEYGRFEFVIESLILYSFPYFWEWVYLNCIWSCSNSSFQLPGFCMPRMLKDEDEGSDSDGGNFEAITPEHDSKIHEVPEMAHAIEKRRHVLEDVDGELEMEDVAPSFDVELNSICNVDGGDASQFEKNLPLSSIPSLPQEVPLSSPPLPSSPSPPPPPPPPLPPPPPPPPPPTLHLMSASPGPYHAAVDSKVFADPQVCFTNFASDFTLDGFNGCKK